MASGIFFSVLRALIKTIFKKRAHFHLNIRNLTAVLMGRTRMKMKMKALTRKVRQRVNFQVIFASSTSSFPNYYFV